jgi:hypothetical protein
MTTQISIQIDAKYCNYMTLEVEGLDANTALTTELATLIDDQDWAASASIAVPTATAWLTPTGSAALESNIYTDGYKIKSTMVLGTEGVANTHGGMCFGFDASENGGYCHVYETDSTGGDLKIAGHYVKWLTATEWSDTLYVEAAGENLTPASAAIVYDPTAELAVPNGTDKA